jgi:hypothetical protein
MTKREKIIIVTMILTILYGTYELFIGVPSKKAKRVKAVSAVSESVKTDNTGIVRSKLFSQMSDTLKEDDAARAETYVAGRAEDDWKGDPFSSAHIVRSERKDVSIGSLDEVKLVYSGYLEIGSKKVAIVNGVDYTVGDELEMGGYTVKQISPASVTVVNQRGGGKIIVPFLEE